jgi:hypothetical protein
LISGTLPYGLMVILNLLRRMEWRTGTASFGILDTWRTFFLWKFRVNGILHAFFIFKLNTATGKQKWVWQYQLIVFDIQTFTFLLIAFPFIFGKRCKRFTFSNSMERNWSFWKR